MTSPTQPGEPAEPRGSDQAHLRTLTNCVFLVTILLCLAALHLMTNLLTPLIVAIFLMILVDSVSRLVARVAPRSPEWARVTVAFVLMTVLLAAAVSLVAFSAPGFAGSVRGLGPQLQVVLTEITARFGLPTAQVKVLLASINLRHYVALLLLALQQMTTGLVLVIIYLGFLLAARPSFENKLRVLFPHSEALGHAERVFLRVRDGAENYVGLQTFKAALLGLISYVIMAAFGLQNALFLAFLVFLGAYVPILGPAAAVIFPSVLAVLQFDLTWRPVAIFVALQALVVVVDNILLPRLQGDRLDVEPVVVLMSLGFWSLIFGMTGALLSTPLTVVVIAIAAETPRLRWLAVALSSRSHSLRVPTQQALPGPVSAEPRPPAAA
jgi:predicted PurR-regulated permease PerM